MNKNQRRVNNEDHEQIILDAIAAEGRYQDKSFSIARANAVIQLKRQGVIEWSIPKAGYIKSTQHLKKAA